VVQRQLEVGDTQHEGRTSSIGTAERSGSVGYCRCDCSGRQGAL
jgi:hypothetical protein